MLEIVVKEMTKNVQLQKVLRLKQVYMDRLIRRVYWDGKTAYNNASKVAHNSGSSR